MGGTPTSRRHHCHLLPGPAGSCQPRRFRYNPNSTIRAIILVLLAGLVLARLGHSAVVCEGRIVPVPRHWMRAPPPRPPGVASRACQPWSGWRLHSMINPRLQDPVGAINPDVSSAATLQR